MLKLKSVEEARGRVIIADRRKFLASDHPAARLYPEDLAEKIKVDLEVFKKELMALR